jgi:hypothetical protein
MPLTMAQIFPMPDAASARLMKLKAACLYRGGVITESQRADVVRKANEILAPAPSRGESRPRYRSEAA